MDLLLETPFHTRVFLQGRRYGFQRKATGNQAPEESRNSKKLPHGFPEPAKTHESVPVGQANWKSELGDPTSTIPTGSQAAYKVGMGVSFC